MSIKCDLLLILLSICASSLYGDDRSIERKLCETSAYVNFSTYAENPYLQSELEFGCNPLPFISGSIDLQAAYRNYSFNPKAYIALLGACRVNRYHEARLGVVAGVSSMYIGSYHSVTPVCGGECLYICHFTSNVSLRVKEMITANYETRHHPLATSLMIGFGFSFGTLRHR